MTIDITTIRSADDLLGLCRAVDLASAEQLEEIAESFAMSNNRDTARELRELAAWKGAQVPPGNGAASSDWFVVEPGDPDALHYMMRPWHLVRIVLANENRLLDMVQDLAGRPSSTTLREALDQLVARQRANIAHLEQRLAALPLPEAGWDEDPDPPFFDQ
jgi:hypothetical protein